MKRLLFIVHRVPYPPDKGERIRAYHELRALSKEFRVTLAALAHDSKDYQSAGTLRQWCERVIVAPAGGKLGLVRGVLGMASKKSVTEGYFHSGNASKLLRKETSKKKYHLVLGYSSSMLPYLLNVPVANRVLDLVDADSAKWFSPMNGNSPCPAVGS